MTLIFTQSTLQNQNTILITYLQFHNSVHLFSVQPLVNNILILLWLLMTITIQMKRREPTAGKHLLTKKVNMQDSSLIKEKTQLLSMQFNCNSLKKIKSSLSIYNTQKTVLLGSESITDSSLINLLIARALNISNKTES